MRRLLCLCLFTILCVGCQNSYKRFFTSFTGERFPRVERVFIYTCSDDNQVGERSREAVASGAKYLGHSCFRGPYAAPEKAKSFAKRIGSNVVFLHIQHLETLNVPFTYHTPVTTYHQGTANAYAWNSYGSSAHAYGSYQGTSTTYVPQTTYIPVAIFGHNAVFCRDGRRLTVKEQEIASKWHEDHCEKED